MNNLFKYLFFFFTIFISNWGCQILQFRYSDEKIIKRYNEYNLTPKIGYLNIDNHKIRYLTVGNDSLPSILMIHGSPSSMSIFDRIIRDSSLQSHARIVTFDRPGYGYSEFGNAMVSIDSQCFVVSNLIDSLIPHNDFVIMAVSYGGPIACQMALRHKNRVKGLVLGAPALAPGLETTFDISYPMTWFPTKWIFPRMLRVASREKFAHKKELAKIEKSYSNINVPLIYIQGLNDGVVHPNTAKYLQENFTQLPYLEINMIPNQKHFLSYPQKDKLVDAMIRMLTISGIKKHNE